MEKANKIPVKDDIIKEDFTTEYSADSFGLVVNKAY